MPFRGCNRLQIREKRAAKFFHAVIFQSKRIDVLKPTRVDNILGRQIGPAFASPLASPIGLNAIHAAIIAPVAFYEGSIFLPMMSGCASQKVG